MKPDSFFDSVKNKMSELWDEATFFFASNKFGMWIILVTIGAVLLAAMAGSARAYKDPESVEECVHRGKWAAKLAADYSVGRTPDQIKMTTDSKDPEVVKFVTEWSEEIKQETWAAYNNIVAEDNKIDRAVQVVFETCLARYGANYKNRHMKHTASSQMLADPKLVEEHRCTAIANLALKIKRLADRNLPPSYIFREHPIPPDADEAQRKSIIDFVGNAYYWPTAPDRLHRETYNKCMGIK